MTEHSRLGASSAYRWLACPGSVRLSEGLEDKPSAYAEEGTRAHELAEKILTGDGFAEVYTSPEMLRYVEVYVNLVEAVRLLGVEEVVEAELTLERLNPPEPMWGVGDYIAWHEEEKHLYCYDLKYGQGVRVLAENNVQLMYYALGAVLYFNKRPTKITVAICQPRVEYGTTEWTFEWEDLIEFTNTLLEGAKATQDPEAPVGPVGTHCRFCLAKAHCPAQQENAQIVAQSEFDLTHPMEGVEVHPALPSSLSKDVLVQVLEAAPYMEDWIKAVRAYALDLLKDGEDVPGFKLVDKRATRKWENDVMAEKWLRRRLKVSGAYSRKLVSPAQAEKQFSSLPRSFPSVVSVSSGVKLAHESSKKPAVLVASAADEFEVVGA